MNVTYRLTQFAGTRPVDCLEGTLAFGDRVRADFAGAVWELWLAPLPDGAARPASDPAQESRGQFGRLCARVREGACTAVNVAVLPAQPLLEAWSTRDYFLVPAALYNGNRFRVLPGTYPPMFHTEDGIGPDMEPLITDVPRLEIGGGMVHLTSGDMSVPCMGGWNRQTGRGFLVYGDAQTPQGYTGFGFREEAAGKAAGTQGAALWIETPCVRASNYRMMDTAGESDDHARDWEAGDSTELRFAVYDFFCGSVPDLFAAYRRTRRCLGLPGIRQECLPFSEAYAIIRDKYVRTQFNAAEGYYMVSPEGGRFGDWQAGWVGGGIHAFAIELDSAGRTGDGEALAAQAAQKAQQTFRSIYTSLQAESGFVYPIVCGGVRSGDDFCHPERVDFLLVRKNADLLHVTAKYLLGREKRGLPADPAVREGCIRLADAFVRLFERYGQIGQFIDLRTEEILAGGTASAGIAVGGLALLFRVTGDSRYLDAARGLAQRYRREVEQGVLCGGPGEILQGADSESAFGLLEGLTALYETCGEREWLLLAADCADQALSWCMPYDFPFPPDSEFGRLDLRTAGSVFANVQNKHSAPAICTLSPLSLLRLARFCAADPALSDRAEEYRITACEIAHNTMQYLSRADRPIRTWDQDELPAGWMCERVNTSDWEGKDHIGGVFRGSCWCEISAMLTYNEIPGVWIDTDRGEVTVFDHLRARMRKQEDGWKLLLENPTPYPARVKLFAEPRSRTGEPFGECRLAGDAGVEIPPGAVRGFFVPRGGCEVCLFAEKEDGHAI